MTLRRGSVGVVTCLRIGLGEDATRSGVVHVIYLQENVSIM